MNQIFLAFLIILFLAFITVLLISLYFLLRKKKREKYLESKPHIVTNGMSILNYQIEMAKERTSNHIIVNSNVDFFDKLGEGSITFNQFIDENNYNINDIFRSVY